MADPTPEEILLDAIEASLPKRTQRRSIAVNYPATLYDAVMTAAEERGISATAFQRRASVAMACVILNIDYDTIMQDEPGVTGFGDKAGWSSEQYGGRGFGDLWAIGSLE